MRHRLALIGHPVAHSRSASYFQQKFLKEGIDGSYILLDTPSLNTLEEEIERHGLTGFNVTAPHKQAILPYLNQLTQEAEAIDAVNTVAIRDGKLIGHNTDAIGFADAIRPLLQPYHTSALVLGNGGAAKAVRYALKNLLHIDYLTIARRGGDLTFEAISKPLMDSHTVIINCTTLGMEPKKETVPLPYHYLTEKHLLFDLVYAPEQTPFLLEGKQKKATVCNGLSMLYNQAEAAWQFWNDSHSLKI